MLFGRDCREGDLNGWPHTRTGPSNKPRSRRETEDAGLHKTKELRHLKSNHEVPPPDPSGDVRAARGGQPGPQGEIPIRRLALEVKGRSMSPRGKMNGRRHPAYPSLAGG